MAIARSTGAWFGTDETTGTAVANNATGNGSEVDMLADNASVGDAWVYVLIISTVTAGSIDITINTRRLTGKAYKELNPAISIPPTNGTQLIPLGKRPISRFVQVDVKNNGTGASATVSVLYELEKLS